MVVAYDLQRDDEIEKTSRMETGDSERCLLKKQLRDGDSNSGFLSDLIPVGSETEGVGTKRPLA